VTMCAAALRALFLFGSLARGDADALSDVDILAVVRNKTGKVPQSAVLEHLSAHNFPRAPTISWYGFDRLKAMYAAGDLFAWHLYLEGKQLHGDRGLLDELGQPATYARATEDIVGFGATFSGVPMQLRKSPHNAIYELGIMYVCVRNVAMSASWHLCDAPDFSRLSPFQLGGDVPPCPLSRAEYERSMSCRMASQRGLKLPGNVDVSLAMAYHESVAPWLVQVRMAVERNTRND
jgi:hypothetical protein